jgi:hypothetical protein
MKKLMFGMVSALALCGLADIESSNIVGYQTKDLEAGKFAIVGVQFEGTDGSTDINKLVTGVTPVSYAEYGNDFVAVAPQIQVPSASGVGYDVYYYLSDGYYIDENGNEAEKAGWCDASGTIAGDDEAGALVSGELIAGVAMWMKDVLKSEDYQQAGQVPRVATLDVTAPTTFALRANAFPVEFDLNDSAAVEFAGLTPGSYAEQGAEFVKFAPQIQVPSASGVGYDVYYYISDGYYIDDNGNEAEKAGWCDASGTIAGDVEAGALVSGIVPAGQGFWTKGVGSSFTITFKK